VDAAAALTAAGHLAASPPAAAGMATAAHFGGGPAAIPPVPVAPRGPAGLVLYCLLAVGCLGLVAVATSKLLAARDLAAAGPAQQAHSGPGDGARPLPSAAPSTVARHAAPSRRGSNPDAPS
jgi:hypothetical protein